MNVETYVLFQNEQPGNVSTEMIFEEIPEESEAGSQEVVRGGFGKSQWCAGVGWHFFQQCTSLPNSVFSEVKPID